MKFKSLFVISIILLIFTVGAVSAVDNSTDDISHDVDDEVLEIEVVGNTFEDIQNTVSQCSDGDTVELNGTYAGSKSPITISKSITIEGNGATLNANKKTSILKVTSKSLTLKNIIFTKSNSFAISSSNCNLEIINCTFTQNGGDLKYDKTEGLYTASCDYAGVCAVNGNLNIVNSTFSDNSIAKIACAVYAKNCQFNARNTVFSNHKLDYGKMSNPVDIISLENSESDIYNCTFNDNTVPAFYTNTYAVIGNSLFNNNYQAATYFGNTKGKITLKDQLNVYNSTFTATQKNCFLTIWDVALNIEECKFTANRGSIINSDSSVTVKNSEFTDNTAENGAVFEAVGNATVINSKFKGNTAQRGSIVYSYTYPGYGDRIDDYVTFINSTVEDSLATVEGGAIYAGCCNIKLINTNISTQKNSKGSQIYLKACNFDAVNSNYGTVKKDLFKIQATYSTIKTSTYDSNKKFCVSFAEKNGQEYTYVSYVKSIFKVYTGKKYKTYYYDASKESQADAFFRITSDLSVGKHKIVVSPNSKYYTFPEKTFTLTIKKAKTTVTAKKVTAKYKKSKYFKVTVKNKASGKVVSKLKIKIKVYTGKKYKTYTLKTNKKGVAKLNTKKLKRGTHKVVITSKNANYEISKKSSIKIK